MAIIGRNHEREMLNRLESSGKSEFLAVYGRRRVGKTYLIKEHFNGKFAFYVTGAMNTSEIGYREQLDNFAEALFEYGAPEKPKLGSWAEAFRALRALIEQSLAPGKKVIFIDEMPWLDTPRSKFISALDYFWNSFASSRKDVLLIACGSATSWIVKKILQNRGGLHNRVTMRMHIEPFTLAECEQYYAANGIVMNRYQMVESYMILGGIPYYLSLLDSRKSLYENIDNLFFSQRALLEGEYKALYESLFNEASAHLSIVAALAKKAKGLNRKEIENATGLTDGGGLTRALDELALSGFIRKYRAFSNKSKGAIFQLIDPFTLFHYKFISRNNDPHFWQKYSITPGHAAWSGYAFEMVCLSHAENIIRKIGAGNALTNIWSWKSDKSKPGAQIDLVVDRSDGVISLCEMKYLNTEVVVNAGYAKELRNKRAAFQAETKTRKALHTVLVTTYGLINNEYASEIQTLVTMDDLFR
ncbi:MAG: ATP-binding protein [Clostridiales Family XIII bacterium]|jgi:AAA+ ATPase superfamily predicted ATPase|nr:ATP-binding protein [Clostridiales Family XIII bacterium]